MNYQEIIENKAFTYPEYFQQMKAFVKNGSSSSLSDQEAYNEYTKLGFARMKRWQKLGKLSPDLIEFLKSQNGGIQMLAITESWCGDSGQNLPFFDKMTEHGCGLHLVYREEEPELMNAHLVNGSKSIPVVIFLDAEYQVLGQWGPRPQFIQEKVLEFKSKEHSEEEKMEHNHKIQGLYNDDAGQTLCSEVLNILKSSLVNQS